MYRLIIMLLLGVVVVSGCKTSHSDATKILDMHVDYIKGSFMPHLPLVCGQVLTFKGSGFSRDTVLKDTILLNRVEKSLRIFVANSKDINYNNCDVRIECELNFANGNSRRICIGDFNCIIIDGKYVGESDSLAYVIKINSGYYNYFDKVVLRSFKEIRKFGIPNNYRQINEL